jgi:hypothetical protein
MQEIDRSLLLMQRGSVVASLDTVLVCSPFYATQASFHDGRRSTCLVPTMTVAGKSNFLSQICFFVCGAFFLVSSCEQSLTRHFTGPEASACPITVASLSQSGPILSTRYRNEDLNNRKRWRLDQEEEQEKVQTTVVYAKCDVVGFARTGRPLPVRAATGMLSQVHVDRFVWRCLFREGW